MQNVRSVVTNFTTGVAGVPNGCQVTTSPSLVTLVSGQTVQLNINITTFGNISVINSPVLVFVLLT